MTDERTLYHIIFYRLLQDRRPAGFTFLFEAPLTVDLQRADIIIFRKDGTPGATEDVILAGLWPLLPRHAIGEYKSTEGRFRSGDLARLIGYAGQYHSNKIAEIHDVRDLALVLLVASMTPTLEAELAAFHLNMTPLGGGYYATNERLYPLYVVLIDEVAVAEKDGLLDLVGHRTMKSQAAYAWFVTQGRSGPEGAIMEKLEGYEELVAEAMRGMSPSVLAGALRGIPNNVRMEGIPLEARLEGIPLEARLEGIPLEERLEGIPPEDRLEGLSREQQILALSDDLLALLSPELLRTLPAAVQEEIERRLARH